ncbi:MAG: YdeI/OmpD-associated family protein [Gammaproteobacteria bacterium]|nr:YdeI/OmpD-associated family protein [Gammaproteobacteria bacterium]
MAGRRRAIPGETKPGPGCAAKPAAKATLRTVSFRSATDFRQWLSLEHSKSNGVMLRICRKGSGLATVSYAEALDVALCFGWIDGQKLPLDGKSWLQRFTPRRPRSAWSRRNTEHVERLMQSGAMTAAGLKEAEAAKADGRWRAAYDPQASAKAPKELLAALSGNARARAFYATLNRANLYAIAYRLQTAKKPETRAKRLEAIVDMLARGERFH